MSALRWHSIAEKPQSDEPVSALLAVRDDDDGCLFLYGICIWKDGHWIDENTGEEASGDYYALEDDLIASIEGQLCA